MTRPTLEQVRSSFHGTVAIGYIDGYKFIEKRDNDTRRRDGKIYETRPRKSKS